MLIKETRANGTVKTVAIFCSADDKVAEIFKKIAYDLGHMLAQKGFNIVTGGSKTGLMDHVVKGYISYESRKGKVSGVLPIVLKSYNVHHPLIPIEELHWTETIHARLAQFHNLADACIILPGGWGTLHELMDFLVSSQFASAYKPVILLNTENFWQPLLEMFDRMVKFKALSPKHLTHLKVASTLEEALSFLGSSSSHSSGLTDLYWTSKS